MAATTAQMRKSPANLYMAVSGWPPLKNRAERADDGAAKQHADGDKTSFELNAGKKAAFFVHAFPRPFFLSYLCISIGWTEYVAERKVFDPSSVRMREGWS